MSSLFYVLISLIALFSLAILGYSFFGKNNWRTIGPFSVAIGCYLYYCGIGPLVLNMNQDLYWNGYDLRKGADAAAILSFLSFVSFLAGYCFFRRKTKIPEKIPHEPTLLRWGVLIWVATFLIQIILVRGNLFQLFNVAGNELDNIDGLSMSQGFVNYLANTVSFMFFAVCCVYQVAYRKFTNQLIFGVLMLSPTLLMFVATGFRLRIVAMLIALVVVYFVSDIRRMNRTIVTVYACAGFTFASVMGAARAYGRGVQLDVLSAASFKDIFLSGFGDSGIFYTTGMVAEHMQQRGVDFTWFDTYVCGLTRVIPSDFWPDKPMSQTLDLISIAHGDDRNSMSAGFFMPYFGENYISFGYVGVIVGSFLFACAIGWVERRMLNGRMLPAIVYALSSAYVFMYFHRGLFPQQLDFFAFIFLPVWLCWKMNPKLTKPYFPSSVTRAI